MTRDPSTETWRETVGLSTSAQLRQTQRDLAASQQDLSHVERQLRDAEDDLNSVAAERDGVREELARQAATNEDLRATLAIRDRQLREAQHELEHVTFQQSMLQTRLDHAREEQGSCVWHGLAVDAMRERDELAEARTWQVARRSIGVACTSCGRPIVRGQAFQPLADAKGYFAHVCCPIEET